MLHRHGDQNRNVALEFTLMCSFRTGDRLKKPNAKYRCHGINRPYAPVPQQHCTSVLWKCIEKSRRLSSVLLVCI